MVFTTLKKSANEKKETGYENQYNPPVMVEQILINDSLTSWALE